MSMDRAESLQQIISFGTNRDDAYAALLKHSWDSESELVVASRQLLSDVLQKYLAGDISSDDLEEWANFIECRDDIDYSEIEDYIYALANPQLMGSIDREKIAKMVELVNAI